MTSWPRPRSSSSSSQPKTCPGSFDTLGARLDNAALLDAAGVTVAIAHFDSHNARNITQEAGIAVANGLPADAALAAVTLNVARAYGMDRDYGTVAVGKVASLVVWDGADPFELSTWAERVFVRGHELEMRSRQTELRDRYMDLERSRTEAGPRETLAGPFAGRGVFDADGFGRERVRLFVAVLAGVSAGP